MSNPLAPLMVNSFMDAAKRANARVIQDNPKIEVHCQTSGVTASDTMALQELHLLHVVYELGVDLSSPEVRLENLARHEIGERDSYAGRDPERNGALSRLSRDQSYAARIQALYDREIIPIL